MSRGVAESQAVRQITAWTQITEVDSDTASHLIGALVTALGLLFVLAGVSKLLRPAGFRGPLHVLTGLPTALLPVAGLLVVAMEIIGGAGLMLGRRAGAVVTLLLLGATTALAFRAIVRRQEVPCACFGSSATQVSRATIVRNLGFAIIAGLPLLAPATTATTPVIVSGVTVLMLYMWFEAVVGGAIRRVRRRGVLPRS